MKLEVGLKNWHYAVVRISAIIIVGLISTYILVKSFSHDSASEKKFSAQLMKKDLSDAAALWLSCNQDSLEIKECGTMRSALRSKSVEQRILFAAGNDSLIGIDFDTRVTIILKRNLTKEWDCLGYPLNSLPKSCNLIR